MATLPPTFPDSANLVLSYTLKVVRNLSIASLVFSVIILITTILGLFIPYVRIFSIGMLVGGNGFWVGGLVFIASILGICGYNKGIYNHRLATAHLVFSIISALAVVGGLILSIITLAGMTAALIGQNHNGDSSSQVASGIIIAAYCGTGLTIAIYIFFFYYCLHGSIIYCKVPRNILVYNVNLSSIPGPAAQVAGSVPATDYANYPPDYSYTPDYSVTSNTNDGSAIQKVLNVQASVRICDHIFKVKFTAGDRNLAVAELS